MMQHTYTLFTQPLCRRHYCTKKGRLPLPFLLPPSVFSFHLIRKAQMADNHRVLEWSQINQLVGIFHTQQVGIQGGKFAHMLPERTDGRSVKLTRIIRLCHFVHPACLENRGKGRKNPKVRKNEIFNFGNYLPLSCLK